MDFLDDLNPQQRKAVTAGPGPVLVIAGPGSGKTRVLTQRVAYLIAAQGVRPWQILAVTFTNKAAREMGARIENLLGEQATQGMMLGTFHSICARLLRHEADQLPIQANFVIFDDDDQERLVKSIIRELNLNEKLYRPASIHASISNAKNELLRPEEYPSQTYRDEVVRRVYEQYQKRLVASNAVDFDDLLLYTARMLEESETVRTKYAERFHHVLIDEFQDTNMAQYMLIRNLASQRRNVFCVGDPDQSIYRWRGADRRNVQRFEEDFPEREVVLLEQNYRSRQNILDVAMGVIDRAQNRSRKRLFSDRGAGEGVFYYEASDEYAEAAFVVDAIAQLTAVGKAAAADCAVMYRTNAQSRLLEEAFLQRRLPYRLVGAQRFYGRREVKDIIAFLRLVHNPADDASLDRVINVPPRGIGEKTILTLHAVARQQGTSCGEVLLELPSGRESTLMAAFSGRATASLAEFGSTLAAWRSAAPTLAVDELCDRIIRDLGYKTYIDDGTEEGADRWENVQELRRLAVEFSGKTLDEFLENVALVSDQDTLREGVDAPTLLTLHAAKGLEFGAVFLVGLDDGLLPHSRSFDEPEGMEEERRLFYVGITRAKDRLYLTRALVRTGRGASEESYPSRFLNDIPEHLMIGAPRATKEDGGRLFSAAQRRGRSDTRWDSVMGTSSARAQPESRFAAGSRVRHPTWGEGIVLESRFQDDDEIVDVAFQSVGIKRLAASLAKMTAV